MPGNTPVDVRTAGNNVIVAGKAGKRIRVWSYVLVGEDTDGPAPVKAMWRSGQQGGQFTDLTGEMTVDGQAIPVPQGTGPLFDTDIGADLVLMLTDAIQVGGHVWTSEIG